MPFVSSWYQSWAIHGAVVMVVVVPPMIFASTVEELLYDDLADETPAVSSWAAAPRTRCSSSASVGEPTLGMAGGFGCAEAAPADEVSSAAATAAATPAAATGRAIRSRRLCRPPPDMGVPTNVPP